MNISKEKRKELGEKIEPLCRRMEAWRKSRAVGERMPESLWEAATQPAKEFGVSPVQAMLQFDYRGLECRATGIHKSKSAKVGSAPKTMFVELPTLAAAPGRAEHTIELEMRLDER